MSTPHNAAKPGDIAETILLPGDPLRAKLIAETFLEDAKCYNEVRGMYGFTGYYKGERVSVQGTGMGVPSIGIYTHELFETYGVKNAIRIGTCGAMREDVKIRDIILGMAASHDSGINNVRFPGMTYAPTADFELLNRAYEAAKKLGRNVRVGNIFSTDTFYNDDFDSFKQWAKFGVLAVEMEAAALYTNAAKFNARALCVLTVSDSLVTHESMPAADRQNTLQPMIEIALEAAKGLK